VFSFLRSSHLSRSFGTAVITCSVFCASLLAPGRTLHAQTAPTVAPHTIQGADYDNRWDLFGGFSYSHFTTTYGHALKTELYGGSGQATYWMGPVIGLSGTIRYVAGDMPLNPNNYGYTTAHMSETLYLVGPDIRILRGERWTVGGHVLIGGTYGRFDSSLTGIPPNFVGLYNNQLAFAVATGATIDYNISPKVSVRVFTDWQPTFYGTAVQKEFAGQLGVVYKMGSIKKK
jgi:hypothetical protein